VTSIWYEAKWAQVFCSSCLSLSSASLRFSLSSSLHHDPGFLSLFGYHLSSSTFDVVGGGGQGFAFPPPFFLDLRSLLLPSLLKILDTTCYRSGSRSLSVRVT